MTPFSDAALRYMLRHAMDPELAARLGVWEEAGAIVWPTTDPAGAVSPRRRSLNGSGPRVRGEAGRSLGVSWPLGTPARPAVVIVTEGESDGYAAATAMSSASPDPAIGRALADLDPAVASIPGTGFPAEKLAEAMRAVGAEAVVLALDADEAGRKATERLGEALRAARLRVGVLPLPEGMDLADALVREEDGTGWMVRALTEGMDLADAPESLAPSPKRTGLLPLLTFEEALALPEPSWLIEPILPAGSLSVLFAPPSAGKSFLALDLALSVAAGIPWLGRTVRPGPVLYVVAEGVRGLGARVRAWWEAHGRPDMGRVRFVPQAVNVLDRTTLSRARATLAALPEPPVLSVFDTVARSMVGGDENAARDMGLFHRRRRRATRGWRRARGPPHRMGWVARARVRRTTGRGRRPPPTPA